MAVHIVLMCTLFIWSHDVVVKAALGKIPVEGKNLGVDKRNEAKRLTSLTTGKSASEANLKQRFRRAEEEEELNRADEQRREYERRLFESLNIIGTVPATRLYVPEFVQDSNDGSTAPFNIPPNTIVGRVRKLFPNGKQSIVWPYFGWRNFTVDQDTGEVRTTTKMDFEFLRLYNMTIRDFRHNYTDDEPLKQPPVPHPENKDDPQRDYVDHYLIVEVVDRNDNTPKWIRDTSGGGFFTGKINTNARAGTPILHINPADDDSGPRGRIRFNIITADKKQSKFTIDPKTHYLKTTGELLESRRYKVRVQALDYGMPPRKSAVQDFTVRVEKTPPEFTGAPYNLYFSEADARGSVVAKVQAISRSGMHMKYEIITEDVKDTFAINHLGEVTLLREIDYDTANDSDKMFTFTVRASEDAYQGRTTDVTVNLRLVNADDHLGMFKTPAKRLEFKEGSIRTGGDIYKIDVEDCDCNENCDCKSGEMIYSLGDTGGFFDITSAGQILNIEDLDYEKKNYFFFPVKVTDPGTNGRTRTSYVEITVLDIDDTQPKFPNPIFDFAIFEDAPRYQVIGVAQALDPDPATKPSDINYRMDNADPNEGRDYFYAASQGVIKVFENRNQFRGSDTYELKIIATDKGGHKSNPSATVKIHVLDVNDHQPVFKECKKQSINEHQPIGTTLTSLTATDDDRGVNKLIEYSLATVQKHNFFAINNQTGEVKTTQVLDREKYDEIFVVAKATDGGPTRSEPLRQIGYCQFVVEVLDVNDHHPIFTVQEYDVSALRTLPTGSRLLYVEAIDPDQGENAVIEYSKVTQKIGSRNADYLEVVKTTGEVKVKSSMAGLNIGDKIIFVIEAKNKVAVVGGDKGTKKQTRVEVTIARNAPPTFRKSKYVGKVKENSAAGSSVLTVGIVGGGSALYSLQLLRDRDNLPFVIGTATGVITTTKSLDYEFEKSYLFAIQAQKSGANDHSSVIVEINVDDVDDVVPIFGNDKYEATVSEAAGGGVDVFRVQASDPDPAGGGKMIYKIEDKFDFKIFTVEERTGYAQIKTAISLKKGFFDREKKSVYIIIIEAYRDKSPGLRSTAVLTVNVRDENDSPPVFAKTDFTAAPIPENIPVPYVVPNLVLNATDDDIFENADVRYFITAGNDGRFAMETILGRDGQNTGRLKVLFPLDAKKSPKFRANPVYTLTVTATDRKHTATATITVRVLDRPDSKPEFLKSFYEKYLPENAGPGLPVVKVEVKKPEDPKAVIRFRLDEKALPYFEINDVTGMITTVGEPLDWEVTPIITFPVYAYEIRSPNITGQTFVRVKINDVNDAPPLFLNQPYVGYIKENLPVGTLVRYINAIDRDNPDINGGKNVRLRYALLTNTGEDPFDKDGKLFKMDSNGRLVTRVKLDAEEFRRNLSIRVRAWDDGNPRLYGETDVTIVIRDESEFPAWFRKEKYEASVSESRPPGFVVLQLTTKDQDFAPPNNYAFSIKSGNYPYAFDINQETGEIVVAGELDIDKTGTKVYNLTVGLKERSDELLINIGIDLKRAFEHTATVKITVIPGNDNRPTFTDPDKTYILTIPENTPVGTRLNPKPLAIEAYDNDLGYSNEFRFMITSGNIGDWFGVVKPSNSSKKAEILIQYPLDREFQDRYDMQLVVIDNGGVSDLAWLQITLEDVNDNPPRFLSPFYTASITEGRCDSNTPLVTLAAVDADEDPQGPFAFAFAPNGNPGNRFSLRDDPEKNSTKLYCTGSVDREATPDLKVVVKVTDDPEPKLSSTANVFIHVKDVDESGESSARMRVVVNAIDGKFVGGRIAQTYFKDNDGDNTRGMTYTLTGSDEFTVQSNDGWISAKSTVKVGKYELKIQGRKGSSRPSCTVDVNVRDVPKEAIENSAAIQLHEVLNTNRFLNPIRQGSTSKFDSITYYDRFVNMLSDLFDVSADNVYVFSIQMSKQIRKPGRPYPAIDVHFAIRKESTVKSPFLPRYILINTLEKNNKTLKEIGFKLGMIGLDYCVEETKKSGMCRNTVRLVGDEYSVVSSDYGLIPVPDYAVAITSITVKAGAEYDRYHQDPDPEYDTCVNDVSCLNGGTCHDVLPRGFVCECPGKYSGPRCQLTTRTFQGNSYIWLPPKTPHNFGSVSLEFATGAANGLLLYQGPAVKDGNNGRGDFLAISLKNGRIQVGLTFGGEPQVFYMDEGPTLNDRKWHHVEVSHQRKEVKLVIDHCKYADIVEDDERIVELRKHCELITRTKQNYQFLNGLGPMQIGGVESMPLDYPSSKFIEYKYFDGCIRKIKENLEMYDLSYPLKVVNAPAGCTIMAECPTCLNGGYCYPGFARSVCSCPAGYIGDDCSGNAPRYWYMANSFTEYTLPGEERRKKRGAAQEPSDLLDRFSNHITMQIRLDPGVTEAIFFYAVSEEGLEYSKLGYEENKLYYEFKLLDALVRLEMPAEADVADGNWHDVVVSREGNTAVLQIDYSGRVTRNTGGTKQLIRMSSAKIVVGGLPDIAPNMTIVDKVVEAAVYDIRSRRRRSAGTILGVTTDGRAVRSVAGDMQGCTGSSSYNGKNLDTDPNVKKARMNVEIGCPCRAVLQCRNGGVCVDAAVPFCQCTHGWSGSTCEDIVYVAPVLGNRVDGRARWKDGGVLVVIFIVVLCVLILAIALLIIKKQREAPYSVPVGDEGQDSIMPYHDDGAGEEDTYNYDINHLMKYSYRDGHGTITKSVNGKDVEQMELLSTRTDGLMAEGSGGGMMTMTSGEKSEMARESVDLWPFILERVQRADEDMSWWPEDEMRHWSDEGDEGEQANLSEIEDSDDEEEAEQDWEFLKDWGKKFENLNKIFNPESDDEDDEETEA
ncbi:protocadherin-like protein isoform X2 [Dendronephthya gigantea]|uniref:protocadherin-like protein isoform X2 n=1 Tax=Dendronephthya gigantea TaxID=151771 RepID=UPI00106A6230|nr:protocadherin-like protein isoform X2 [Dendronephthya gigantea]